MNRDYMVVYKKKNGKIITRYISVAPLYEIGYENSYGWVVIDIKYLWLNGEYVSQDEYYRRLRTYRIKEKTLRYKFSRFLENWSRKIDRKLILKGV